MIDYNFEELEKTAESLEKLSWKNPFKKNLDDPMVQAKMRRKQVNQQLNLLNLEEETALVNKRNAYKQSKIKTLNTQTEALSKAKNSKKVVNKETAGALENIPYKAIAGGAAAGAAGVLAYNYFKKKKDKKYFTNTLDAKYAQLQMHPKFLNREVVYE